MEIKKILLVNDDYNWSYITEKIINRYFKSLRSKKFDLICDYRLDALSAFDTTDIFSYSIIITDLFMPLMDGKEFIAKLREIGYMGRIIITTAIHPQDERVKSLEKDYNVCLSLKVPFDSNVILGPIVGMLEVKEIFLHKDPNELSPPKLRTEFVDTV